jgi:hypothetical protein
MAMCRAVRATLASGNLSLRCGIGPALALDHGECVVESSDHCQLAVTYICTLRRSCLRVERTCRSRGLHFPNNLSLLSRATNQ